jgi:hypothetical protein
MRKFLMVAALGLLAFDVSAQDDAGAKDASVQKACEANYAQEGSFFAGRKFTNWGVVPVSADVALKRIKREGVKAGLTFKAEDKDIGMLQFEQQTKGDKGMVTLPWNIMVEAQGKNSSKVSITKLYPPTHATSEKFQRDSTCGVIQAALEAP